jgi:hypothetical protein
LHYLEFAIIPRRQAALWISFAVAAIKALQSVGSGEAAEHCKLPSMPNHRHQNKNKGHSDDEEANDKVRFDVKHRQALLTI